MAEVNTPKENEGKQGDDGVNGSNASDDKQKNKLAERELFGYLMMSHMIQNEAKKANKMKPEEVTPDKLHTLAVEEYYREVKKRLVSGLPQRYTNIAFDENERDIVKSLIEKMLPEKFTVEQTDNFVAPNGVKYDIHVRFGW